MKKSRMVMKFDSYSALINCGNRILIVFQFYYCSKQKKIVYDTFGECCEPYSFCYVNILIQNIKILVYFISIYLLYMITSMGYSKHELSTINMSSPKNLSYYRGTQRRFPPKYVENTFCAVQSTFRSLEKHSKRR